MTGTPTAPIPPGSSGRTAQGTGWAVASANAPGGGTPRGFSFGNLDDLPVVGDRDAGGSDTPAVVRPAVEYIPPPPVPVAPAPTGQPASRHAVLTVRFTRARQRRVGFRTKPTVTGRLVDERGTAIAGATLVVLARRRRSPARWRRRPAR